MAKYKRSSKSRDKAYYSLRAWLAAEWLSASVRGDRVINDVSAHCRDRIRSADITLTSLTALLAMNDGFWNYSLQLARWTHRHPATNAIVTLTEFWQDNPVGTAPKSQYEWPATNTLAL